jgi:ribonuclease J
VDTDEGSIISGPDIISRGFVYVRESEQLLEEIKTLARKSLDECLEESMTEWTEMKTTVRDTLSKYLYSKTKRKPMILPVIMNV